MIEKLKILFVNYLVLNNVRVCLFMKMKKLQKQKKIRLKHKADTDTIGEQ